MKKCYVCGEEKTLSEFGSNKSTPDGLNRKCKVCYAEYMRLWYSNNTEKHKARVNSYRDPAKTRAGKYGLTVEQVDAMMKLHQGMCHICKKRKATHVDHCHRTNKVRGVLCMLCNTGLGKLGDDIEGLENALRYLRG